MNEYFVGVTVGLRWPMSLGLQSRPDGLVEPWVHSWLLLVGPLSLAFTFYRPVTSAEHEAAWQRAVADVYPPVVFNDHGEPRGTWSSV